MLIQGKHAKVEYYEKQIKIFKTYDEHSYNNNEFFALNFLANNSLMNINPQKESDYSLSMDYIDGADKLNSIDSKQIAIITKKLVSFLQQLHKISFEENQFFITHEDIFLDNILATSNLEKIYLIDWGLSKKRENIYPDIASATMGIYNDFPHEFDLFLQEYFKSHYMIDFDLLQKNIEDRYKEYYSVRKKNNFETDSLKVRYNKALSLINNCRGKYSA